MKYCDIEIKSLDLQYLDHLSEVRGIDWSDLDIDPDLLLSDPCNSILYEFLITLARREVENEKDREKIIDRIYCNCIDSGYDISEEELETEQAKEFISNF